MLDNVNCVQYIYLYIYSMYVYTWMLGFCELMSASASSGKFCRSMMKGLMSSSGSGSGSCWDQWCLDLSDDELVDRV